MRTPCTSAGTFRTPALRSIITRLPTIPAWPGTPTPCVRFISDPAIQSSASLQTGGRMPAAQQKHVCHLTLWHSTRDQKPGFYICYTLDFTEGKLNPPEVRGAYCKDADGKGYTF